MTERESAAAKLLGRKGGRSTSEAKVQASRDNGKRGGRPKIIKCECLSNSTPDIVRSIRTGKLK